MFNVALAARGGVWLLIVITFPLLPRPAAAAESASLAGTMPAGAVAYAEVAGLGRVIDRIQHSALLNMVTASPQYQAWKESRDYQQAQAVQKIAETQLGMDLWTAGKKVFGGRLAVGVYPRPGRRRPDVVAVLRVADAQVLAHIRQRAEPFLVLLGDAINTSETIAGTDIIGIGHSAFVATRDDWVAAASTRELLQTTVGLLTGTEQTSLANDQTLQTMTQQMGADHLLRVFVNTGAIREAMGGRFGPDKLDNVLASLVLGGIYELAVRSSYAGLTLGVEQNQFVVTAGVDGGPQRLGDAHQAFFSDPAGPGTAAIPEPPSLIAGFTLHRDFADWYRRREELLQPHVLPGFDKFETGLANLLPGRDFGEDVLPLVGQNLTFVAAPQDYGHLDGEPGIKIPGFAAIVDLAQPQEGADVFQLFFQTLTGLLNVQAGQQGRQPWVMTSETYKDVQIAYGRYLTQPSGDRLSMVFNFMPASARVGDKYIISSSRGLCRQLIDELTTPATGAKRPNRNLLFDLHADPLADILEANREFFQAQAIKQGRSPQQAEKQFAGVLDAIRSFESLQFHTSVKPDAFQVQLKGSWK